MSHLGASPDEVWGFTAVGLGKRHGKPQDCCHAAAVQLMIVGGLKLYGVFKDLSIRGWDVDLAP